MSEHTHTALLRLPYLEQLGLVINQELKVLICEGCAYAFPPKGVKEHINKKHKNAKVKSAIDQTQVQSICDQHHVLADLPILDPASDHVQYLGLALHSGLKCGHCAFICGEMSTLETHYKKESDHPAQPPTSPTNIHYQQLAFRGKRSKFFTVQPRQVPTKVDAVEVMIAELRKAANSAGGDATSNLNSRQINPWMLTTKWYLSAAPSGAAPRNRQDFGRPRWTPKVGRRFGTTPEVPDFDFGRRAVLGAVRQVAPTEPGQKRSETDPPGGGKGSNWDVTQPGEFDGTFLKHMQGSERWGPRLRTAQRRPCHGWQEQRGTASEGEAHKARPVLFSLGNHFDGSQPMGNQAPRASMQRKRPFPLPCSAEKPRAGWYHTAGLNRPALSWFPLQTI
ncbi:hypothetical protein FIBSPDRAFT_977040 [Athelia psychrophila]|uniref:C2H2-type domain-containing protein n=1 Tax=Athelia psychrophila TaxID=1759441 RepID=A0A166TWS8_9AGAM|nr:hypothetical protein FIBSPDRAFT_977040 [Fibularhizoctonia sp. CBS 109695]